MLKLTPNAPYIYGQSGAASISAISLLEEQLQVLWLVYLDAALVRLRVSLADVGNACYIVACLADY